MSDRRGVFQALLLVVGIVTGIDVRALAQGPASQPTIGIDDPTWRLESSGDGIQIYRGSVPGVGIVPVKATMTVPGTIEEMSLALEDLPRRKEWVSHLNRTVLLDRPSDYEQTEYERVDVPWPASDRSAVIRARVTVSDDLHQATIAAESVDAPLPDSLPSLVRSRVYASTFQMTQTAGTVGVVALVFIDPRGSIPKWIVNFFTRRVARATLNGLRRQVARRLYSAAQIAAMHRRIEAYHAYRAAHRGS